jgi:hypothetical protein
MSITLDAGGGDVVTMTSLDADGPDGPTPPANIVVGDLTAGATYSGSIVLLDESDPNDIENITLEVEEEDLEHQFYFCVTALDASVSGENLDSEGNVLGTMFTLTVGNAGSGTLTFTLLHDGDKEATVDGCNVSSSAQAGEIDIEQTFSVDIL